jgi:3-hydroxymyristoyl/3-hydroxydecanoyl-(acyl carrier protein) dehydratase
VERGVIERVFPADHPAARGHFPGNPIIPGAVLLSESLEAIGRELGGAGGPLQVRSAKFSHPVRPGERVQVQYSRDDRGEIRFTCAVEGRPVLTGQVTCSGPPTAK